MLAIASPSWSPSHAIAVAIAWPSRSPSCCLLCCCHAGRYVVAVTLAAVLRSRCDGVTVDSVRCVAVAPSAVLPSHHPPCRRRTVRCVAVAPSAVSPSRHPLCHCRGVRCVTIVPSAVSGSHCPLCRHCAARPCLCRVHACARARACIWRIVIAHEGIGRVSLSDMKIKIKRDLLSLASSPQGR